MPSAPPVHSLDVKKAKQNPVWPRAPSPTVSCRCLAASASSKPAVLRLIRSENAIVTLTAWIGLRFFSPFAGVGFRAYVCTSALLMSPRRNPGHGLGQGPNRRWRSEVITRRPFSLKRLVPCTFVCHACLATPGRPLRCALARIVKDGTTR